ncbi:alkaline invertase, partial [filamentous cyanobacterium CCP2]
MSKPTSSHPTFPDATLVQTAQDLLYEQAMVQIQGAWAGTLAAIPPKSPRTETIEPDLNYSELFIRDNIPVMIYLLIQGKHDIVRHFLTLCLTLQSNHPPTQGIFPTSFVEEDGKLLADYGQRAIGRVISVDATLWWVILAHCYVERSGDRDFALQPEVQQGLQNYLNLILRPSFRAAPTLFVPDGAFMIDRPMDVWGTPLEIQVLLYGSLLSAIGLMQVAEG